MHWHWKINRFYVRRMPSLWWMRRMFSNRTCSLTDSMCGGCIYYIRIYYIQASSSVLLRFFFLHPSLLYQDTRSVFSEGKQNVFQIFFSFSISRHQMERTFVNGHQQSPHTPHPPQWWHPPHIESVREHVLLENIRLIHHNDGILRT